MLLVKAATSFSSLKNSLAYLWLGFAYICVTTLFLIVNFSSEHFKYPKGVPPISPLRSAEVSSQVVKDHLIKKNLSLFHRTKFYKGKVEAEKKQTTKQESLQFQLEHKLRNRPTQHMVLKERRWELGLEVLRVSS